MQLAGGIYLKNYLKRNWDIPQEQGGVVAHLERCSGSFRSKLIITQNRRAAHQVQHMDIARPQPTEEPRLTSRPPHVLGGAFGARRESTSSPKWVTLCCCYSKALDCDPEPPPCPTLACRCTFHPSLYANLYPSPLAVTGAPPPAARVAPCDAHARQHMDTRGGRHSQCTGGPRAHRPLTPCTVLARASSKGSSASSRSLERHPEARVVACGHELVLREARVRSKG